MSEPSPEPDRSGRGRAGLVVVAGVAVWAALTLGDVVALWRDGNLHGAGAWLAALVLVGGLAMVPAALLVLVVPALSWGAATVWRLSSPRTGGPREAGAAPGPGANPGPALTLVAGSWVATGAGFACLRGVHWLLDNVKDHRLGAAFFTLVGAASLGLAAAAVAPLAKLLATLLGRRVPPRWVVVGAALLPPLGAAGALLLSSWVGVSRVPWAPAGAVLGGLVAAAVARTLLLRSARLGRYLRRASGRAALACLALTTVGLGVGAVLVGSGAGEALRASNDRTWFARPVARVLRAASDVDGDGYSSLFGGGDCAPFDAARNPGAKDIPDNGVDENCLGGDRRSQTRSGPTWQRAPAAPGGGQWSYLILVMDAVRADHVSALGYGRLTTPRLDELAARSLLFERAYSPAATTRFSVPALLMGRYPSSIKWRRRGRSLYLAKRGNRSLPARLATRGVYTGAVLCGYDIFERGFGLSAGFRDYDTKSVRYPNNRTIVGRTADQVTDAVLAMVARAGESPFFVYAHYMDPHAPYDDPGGPTFGDRDVDRYDAEILHTDAQIGRLLDEIATLRDPARIVVVVTADHGDQFRERGRTGHGRFVYDEEVHVPLVVHIPGQPAARVQRAVSIIDVPPTVANLAGARSHWGEFEGRNLLGFLPGRQPDEHDTVVETWPFADFGQRRVALIDPPHKMIFSFAGRSWELFDLASDPGERRNLMGRADERVQADLRARLEHWLEGHALR